MRALLGVAVVVAALGCKHQETSTPSTPAKPAPQPARNDLDALWALAPPQAEVGVVVSAHGLAMLDRALATVRTRSPELVAELQRRLGAGELTPASFGLAVDRAVAVFATDRHVVVMPVADRKQLAARLHSELACATVDGRLACATSEPLLDVLGKGTLRVADLGEHGDIEVALAPAHESLRISAVAQLTPGTLVAHAAIANVPAKLLAA